MNYLGRRTHTQFRRKSLQLSMHLSESDLLFQYTLLLKVTESSFDKNLSYVLNSLSRDNLPLRRAKQKADVMYRLRKSSLCTDTLIGSPQFIFVTVSLDLGTLSFDLRKTKIVLQNI